MSLLIHNVTIVTNEIDNRVLQGAVAIAGQRIVAVGAESDLRAAYPEFDRLDGDGRLLMPGLTNVHMHFYGTYARGMPLSKPMHNFHEILMYLWWALDKTLDLDAVYYSALLPAITSVKKGVTSVIDHHASPHAVMGSLDKIEEALDQIGMRGILCYELSDRDGKAIRDLGLAENRRYIEKCRAAKAADPAHRFDAMMGLHASFTIDDESLEMAVAIANQLDRGCHIHMLEDKVDEMETRRKYGQGVVERLAQFGVLGPKSITAHGIFLDDAAVDLLKESDTIIAHQAMSNMNNAVGRADVFRLLDKGLTVGIGTDGMTPDLRNELRTGWLMHKHHLADNNAGWGAFETMGRINNPVIFERLSGQAVGRVAPGYLADLILVDYFPPTPLDGGNFWGHFLFGLVDAAVDTTIIDGRIVMQGKVLPGIDEKRLAAESRLVAEQVWQRFQQG